MLRVSRAHFPVTSLGPGTRLALWLQGCQLACRGCMSRDTWDPAGGTDISEADLLRLWRDALAAGATGLTISGGEPLAQAAPLTEFLRAARTDTADILLYTGYELAELDEKGRAAVAAADAVITGRYEAGQPTRLIWRGSANQRLVTNTSLGETRYAEYLDLAPDRAPVQIGVDGERLWVVGVPAPGALPRMERVLRAQGIRFEEVAWRP